MRVKNKWVCSPFIDNRPKNKNKSNLPNPSSVAKTKRRERPYSSRDSFKKNKNLTKYKIWSKGKRVPSPRSTLGKGQSSISKMSKCSGGTLHPEYIASIQTVYL